MTQARLAHRLQHLGTTIFAEMSALAVRTKSVNLGQGFPDSDGPDEIIESAVAALRSGRNQYAPGIGIPALRAAVADHQSRFYDQRSIPTPRCSSPRVPPRRSRRRCSRSSSPATRSSRSSPTTTRMRPASRWRGASVCPVTLHAPDFRLDTDALRAAITARTKALLINSPHNPTGTVLDDAELRCIAELANEHDLLVITDEVYEHLTFDGHAHHPLASYDGMRDRTVTISSAGKTFSFTGWKVGWVCASAALVAAVTPPNSS